MPNIRDLNIGVMLRKGFSDWACGRTHQPSQAHQTRSVWSSWTLLPATPLLACCLRSWHSEDAGAAAGHLGFSPLAKHLMLLVAKVQTPPPRCASIFLFRNLPSAS